MPIKNRAPDPLLQIWQRLFHVRSFGRFLVVGVVNTGIGLSTFPALFWLFYPTVGINSLLAISYIFCTIFSFGSHKVVTFASRDATIPAGIKFFLLSGATYVINLLLLNALLWAVSAHPIILQTSIAVGLQLLNYHVSSYLVFPNSAAKKDAS